MKFDMHATALADYGKKADTTHQDLGALINELVAAAEPLEKKFNGEAKAAFNTFHQNTHTVSDDLKSAYGAIMGSVAEQDRAFKNFQINAGEAVASTANAQQYDLNVFKGH